jgi:hypothetical protein
MTHLIVSLYDALIQARLYVYEAYSREGGTEGDLAVLDQIDDALEAYVARAAVPERQSPNPSIQSTTP